MCTVGFVLAVSTTTAAAACSPSVVVIIIVVGELVDNVTLRGPFRVGMDGQSHLLNVLVPVVVGLVDGLLLLLLVLLIKRCDNGRQKDVTWGIGRKDSELS